MSNFQLVGLEHSQFQPLFELSDAQLRARGIVRKRASENPGYPCRISLQDAAVGEEVLLLPYCHQPVDSPYRSLGAIYIRRGVSQVVLLPGEVPEYVTRRLISLRAYDGADMMVGAEVCEGRDAAKRIRARFQDAQVTYIHLHNARPGCFSCLAKRA